jgi:flagellar assembly protein FliH
MVMKNLNSEVKSFSFQSLVPSESEVVDTHNASDFKLQTLNSADNLKNEVTEDTLRSERESANITDFSILPIIKELRGHNRQKADDIEAAVQAELKRRYEAIKQQGYDEGFEAGKKTGWDQAYTEATEKFSVQITSLEEFAKNAINQFEELLLQNKNRAFEMIKNLTKWVILKEMKDDTYLPLLLEKLVYEMNTKNNLVIRVNKHKFEAMPEIIEKVESKLGALQNVRVEIEQDMHNDGIILESENGIIDGSIDAQFKSIDRLFESVGLDKDE